jgi:hypothetical protein
VFVPKQQMMTPRDSQNLPLTNGAGILMVPHEDFRQIHHAPTQTPKTHAVIDILEISRRKSVIQSAQLLEQIPPGHQERTGAIIHVALKQILRRRGIVAAAILQDVSLAPQSATGFLQTAIQENDATTHRANVVLRSQKAHRGAQAIALNFGVIVQKKQILASGRGGRLVDAVGKTVIFFVANRRRTFNAIKQQGCVIVAAIVREDNFRSGILQSRQEGPQARQRQFRPVV